MFRVAVYDLESTSLKGDLARCLCGSILSLPSNELVTYRLDDTKRKSMADDKALVEQIRDKLEEHHMVVTWNGKGFDWPLLQTRLAAHGLRSMRPILHLDAMWAAKGWRGLMARNAKLATVAEFFDLPERKMDVDISVWVNAAAGDRACMDILCERCESDVRLLAGITEKLLDAGFIGRIERYP